MWTATRISADAAEKLQVNAGILLKNFDVSNPVEPLDEDIICETTGDFSFSCTPTIVDLLEDVNNAPAGTKEAAIIRGWECSATFSGVSITLDTLMMALGAADQIDKNDGGMFSPIGVTARNHFIISNEISSDFKEVYWIGDMSNPNKLFVVQMENAASVGGLEFSARNNGTGSMNLTIKPHKTLLDLNKIPMSFYILEKIEDNGMDEEM